ncbi:hypothetical protein HMI55_001601 [Coelomomyces lativittatus]|nr:hypothetical protein HMI55_001601 [Coelomomyces lativittatus]
MLTFISPKEGIRGPVLFANEIEQYTLPESNIQVHLTVPKHLQGIPGTTLEGGVNIKSDGFEAFWVTFIKNRNFSLKEATTQKEIQAYLQRQLPSNLFTTLDVEDIDAPEEEEEGSPSLNHAHLLQDHQRNEGSPTDSPGHERKPGESRRTKRTRSLCRCPPWKSLHRLSSVHDPSCPLKTFPIQTTWHSKIKVPLTPPRDPRHEKKKDGVRPTSNRPHPDVVQSSSSSAFTLKNSFFGWLLCIFLWNEL